MDTELAEFERGSGGFFQDMHGPIGEERQRVLAAVSQLCSDHMGCLMVGFCVVCNGLQGMGCVSELAWREVAG